MTENDLRIVELRENPRCDHTYTVDGFAGGRITWSCHFDHGHPGMHQDPATGTEWTLG